MCLFSSFCLPFLDVGGERRRGEGTSGASGYTLRRGIGKEFSVFGVGLIHTCCRFGFRKDGVSENRGP